MNKFSSYRFTCLLASLKIITNLKEFAKFNENLRRYNEVNNYYENKIKSFLFLRILTLNDQSLSDGKAFYELREFYKTLDTNISYTDNDLFSLFQEFLLNTEQEDW